MHTVPVEARTGCGVLLLSWIQGYFKIVKGTALSDGVVTNVEVASDTAAY